MELPADAQYRCTCGLAGWRTVRMDFAKMSSDMRDELNKVWQGTVGSELLWHLQEHGLCFSLLSSDFLRIARAVVVIKVSANAFSFLGVWEEKILNGKVIIRILAEIEGVSHTWETKGLQNSVTLCTLSCCSFIRISSDFSHWCG